MAAMLDALNDRIEYLYDRDHTIGHAYFLGVTSFPDLDAVFRRRVIPLCKNISMKTGQKSAGLERQARALHQIGRNGSRWI